MQALDIQLCEETLTFDPRKCIYWARHRALILSDWHIGKSAHFRKHGIAIPAGVAQKDLDTLEELLEDYEVVDLWVIGDMFHAQHNRELEFFAEWRNNHNKLKIKLIGGNHDIISKDVLKRYKIEFIKKSLGVEPFTFSHKPKTHSDARFFISGHIHPGVELHGKGNLKVKLPCFIVGKEQLVLPAFSNFTGLDTRYRLLDNEYRHYAVAENEIILIEQ